MYKIGDKVKIKNKCVCALTKQYAHKVGEVINIHEDVGYTKMQVCRVLFGPTNFDYDDIADYRLSRAKT